MQEHAAKVFARALCGSAQAQSNSGGIPTAYDPKAERKLVGVECAIDKDLATELLARELGADLYVMLTDADAVYDGWGTPAQRAILRASPDALAAMQFAAGSMGPKVDAAAPGIVWAP